MRAAWSVSTLALALACRPSTRESSTTVPHESGDVVYEGVVVEAVTLLPEDAGLLLVGRARPDPSAWTFVPWIAIVDHEGRLVWRAELDMPNAWAETASLDPMGGIHVYGRSLAGDAWLLSDEGEGAHAIHHELPSEPLYARVADPIVNLELGLTVGEVESIALGRSSMIMVQLPPQAGHDARFVVGSRTEAELGQARVEFARLGAAPLALADLDPDTDPDPAFAWLVPIVSLEVLARDPTTRASLGPWLTAGECELQKSEPFECDRDNYVYPEPSSFAPSDACWRQALVGEYLTVVEPEDFASLIDTWIEWATRDFQPDSPGVGEDVVLNSPSEAVLEAARRTGHVEHFIDPLARIQNSDATQLAFALLRSLPQDHAIRFVEERIAGLRNDTSACAEVRDLLGYLDQEGHPRPIWQADRTNACDVLYVLCTELEPSLGDAIIGPRGYRRVESCDASRPTDQLRAAELGLEPCRPFDARVHGWDFVITPLVAQSCGTDAALINYRHTCGVNIELSVHEFEFVTTSSADVRLERVTILHTSGD